MNKSAKKLFSFFTKSVFLHVAFQLSSATVLIMYLESSWRKDAIEVEKVRLRAEADLIGVIANTADPRDLSVLKNSAHNGADGRPFESLLVNHAGRKLGGTLPAWPRDVRTDVGTSRDFILDARRGAVSLVRPLAGGNTLLLRKFVNLGHSRTILVALMGAVLLGLDAAVVAAVLQSRSMNRRARRIADVTHEVQHGKLDRRIPRTFNRDPFDRLSAALNLMFAGIERSVGEMRAMTDAIAHDLRSPMMRIRVRVEELCVLPLPDEAHANLDRILEEMDDIVSMLEVALEISRAESGVARSQFVLLDLGLLIENIVENYQPVAETNATSLSFEVKKATVIVGHKQLLGQLITNLIENALAHGGAGGALHLSLHQDVSDVLLRVRDTGPGIRSEDRALALSRFGRLDAARLQAGAGLGLALVQSICHLHSGSIELLEANPGLLVEVRLPCGDGLA